jgi:predicted permease
MADEMQFHLESRTQELARRHGLPHEEALRQARLEFGSLEKYKEEARRARGLRILDELRGDLLYASRQFRQNKAFTFVAVLMLSIGIGANTWAFNQVNDVILRSLPVLKPAELRQVWYSSANDGFRTGGNGYQRPDTMHATSISYPAYKYLRDRTTSLIDLFCFSGPQTVNVGTAGRAESATALLVSGNYFRSLGIHADFGRTLLPDDDQAGPSSDVAVLGYGFWQRVFGGDPTVVGKTLVINGKTVSIVGITPRAFLGMNPEWRPDLFLPMAMQPVTGGRDILKDSGNWSFLVFGRLQSGENEERARLETERLLQEAIISGSPARPYDPPKVTLAPAGRGFRSRDVVSPAVLSLSVVAVVLLIACANIAGMLLARSAARRREIGTRLALGAPRGRIVRQLMTESLLLSGIGGIIGIALALVMNAGQPEPDLLVLGFSAALTLLTGIVFGLAPALHATRFGLVTMLKPPTSHSASRYAGFRSGKALVTLQVALSLLLLIGAGLFMRTLFNLRNQAFGFDIENVLIFRMNPSLNGYSGERLANFYEDALKQIHPEPGVTSASISRWGILNGASSSGTVCVPDFSAVSTHPISPGYFETMRIPLLVGRDIGWRDRENMPRVAIVNEAFVKKFYGEKNPIGKSFQFDCRRDQPGSGDATEIIGVAGNTKYFSIRDSMRPAVYYPYRQSTERWMTFAIRTKDDPKALIPAIRNVLTAMDPNLPIYDVSTQREWIDFNVYQERRFAMMLVALGTIAVLLACSGIYGTLAYLVNRRTSEIGIRMAIGARQPDVVRMIVRESLGPVVLGIGLGLLGAFGLTRFVAAMLYGVEPDDLVTMIVATVFLFLTAAVASLLPALRASRIDPMAALRCE